MALASHGVTMTMDGWRDMTLRDRAELTRAVNELEQKRRRASRRRR